VAVAAGAVIAVRYGARVVPLLDRLS